MNKNKISHVGETVGIYKIIGVSDKKKNGKTLHVVQCTKCGQVFEKMYNSISGKKIKTTCRHNNKSYVEQDVYCKNCGTKIERNGMPLSEYANRMFCSQSCAASYNNHNYKRQTTKSDLILSSECLNCHKPISHRNKFCSIECQQDYRYKEYIDKWKSGEISGLTGNAWIDVSRYIRRYLFEKFDYKCSRCGWSEINPYTGTLPLEIEHIDGDATNNKEENLTLLCPNCHSLTKTYRGANKGNGTRDIKWLSRCGTKNTDLTKINN